MQPSTDIQYLIDNDFLQKTYKLFEKYDKPYISINSKGSYYRVYNFYIYKFLTTKKVDTHRMGSIDGTQYVDSYVEGYKDGKEQFEQVWPLSVFHGNNAAAYVNSLHRKCFHEYNQIFEGDGWLAAAQNVPYLINHTAIKYYGFFCAKIAEYDIVIDNYSELFESLVKCEYQAGDSKNRATGEMLTPPPNPGGDEPKHVLFLVPDAYHKLVDSLKKITEPDEHLAIEKLINDGEVPEKPIVFTSTVKQFGLTFYKNKAVPDQGAKTLSEQLPLYFRKNVGSETRELKPSILVKYLRGDEVKRRQKTKQP